MIVTISPVHNGKVQGGIPLFFFNFMLYMLVNKGLKATHQLVLSLGTLVYHQNSKLSPINFLLYLTFIASRLSLSFKFLPQCSSINFIHQLTSSISINLIYLQFNYRPCIWKYQEQIFIWPLSLIILTKHKVTSWVPENRIRS